MNYGKGPTMYAGAVCLLIERRRTTSELAESLGVVYVSASQLVRAMYRRGLIHIADWRAPPSRGDHIAVWAFGPGEDAPTLGRSCKPPRSTKASYAGAVAFCDLCLALLTEPCTVHDLVERSDLGISTVYRIVKVMREHEAPALRIADWDSSRTTKCPLAAFMFGVGSDAKRPAPMPMRVVNRRYRERRKERKAFAPLAEAMNQPNFNLARSA